MVFNYLTKLTVVYKYIVEDPSSKRCCQFTLFLSLNKVLVSVSPRVLDFPSTCTDWPPPLPSDGYRSPSGRDWLEDINRGGPIHDPGKTLCRMLMSRSRKRWRPDFRGTMDGGCDVGHTSSTSFIQTTYSLISYLDSLPLPRTPTVPVSTTLWLLCPSSGWSNPCR